MSSWISFPLSDLPVASGRSINPCEFPDEEFELYSVPSHETGRPEVTVGSDVGSNKQIVSSGTVLLCKINPRINRTWIVGKAGNRRQIASTEWIAFESCEEVDQRYLMYFLQQSHIRDYLAANASGVGGSLMRIKPATLKGLTFRMPGTRTQRKIVEKLEELLSDLDAGVAELKAAQRKLAHYRQSLLKAAVEGELSADWRATHGKPRETGAELLQRILFERRTRWEQRQLAKFAEQGKTPPTGWKTKYPEPVAPDVADLPTLPEGWEWVGFDQVFDALSDGGKKLPQSEYVDSGRFQVIDQGAKQIGGYTEDASLLFNGELPVIIFGDHTRRFKLLQTPFVLGADGAKLIGLSEAWNPNFAFIALEALEFEDRGYSRHFQFVRGAVFPLPPIEEQNQIAELFASQVGNQLELLSALSVSLRGAAAQRKNLLRAAFAGQLVPQDPNDEPASALLARIRAERASNVGSPPRRRRKTA